MRKHIEKNDAEQQGILGPLWKRREVADACKVHPETIKRWQRDGRLPAVILSPTCVRYRESDVRALIENASIGVAA